MSLGIGLHDGMQVSDDGSTALRRVMDGMLSNAVLVDAVGMTHGDWTKFIDPIFSMVRKDVLASILTQYMLDVLDGTLAVIPYDTIARSLHRLEQAMLMVSVKVYMRLGTLDELQANLNVPIHRVILFSTNGILAETANVKAISTMHLNVWLEHMEKLNQGIHSLVILHISVIIGEEYEFSPAVLLRLWRCVLWFHL